MHDEQPDNSQAMGKVGSVHGVGKKTRAGAKGGYIEARREQLSMSCSGLPGIFPESAQI